MKIFCVLICILLIIAGFYIYQQHITITNLQHSRQLWQDHAMRTADWRTNNHQSDYDYLTVGKELK